MAQDRRLKLRLRVCDGQGRGKVEIPGDCLLGDLKAAVKCKLGVGADDSLELSLNQKDMLQDSQAPVTSQGVCSGDLIWVHGLLPGQSQPSSVAMEADAQTSSAPQPNYSSALLSTKSDASAQRVKVGNAAEVGGSAPSKLRVLCSAASTRQQQMRAAVVAILLDSNLQLSPGQDYQRAAAGDCRRVTFALLPLGGSTAAESNCTATVAVSAMAGHAVVCGAAEAEEASNTRTVSSLWDAHVTKGQQQAAGSSQSSDSTSALASTQSVPLGHLINNARDFVMNVKDLVATPLIADLCAAEGLPPPLSLATLPVELLLQCLGFLQAQHLAKLSCVSRSLRPAASSNELWRPLFQAEFGEAYPAESVAGNRCWQALFASRHKQRAERQANARRQPRMPGLRGIRGPQHAFVPPPPFPGMIGGDADRLPFLGGGARGRFGGGSASGFFPGFRQH